MRKKRIVRLFHCSIVMVLHYSAVSLFNCYFRRSNGAIEQWNNRRGFTLIELIVVFSTIAFLSIIGIASYRTYSESQILESLAQDFVTTVQLAKSRANSQVKPPVCVGQLDGYSVVISNVNQYVLNVVCSGNSFPLQTTALPNNIQFSQDALGTIFFAIITGAVSGNGNIVMTGYNQTKCVSVDSLGLAKLSSCP